MNKIIYTQTNGMVAIVIPNDKAKIEVQLGPLTDTEYEQHVWDRSVPADAINPRSIDDSDLPNSREFRDAWTDSEPGSQIDIDCSKAKEICLKEMNLKKKDQIKELASELAYLQAINDETGVDSTAQKITDLKAVTDGLESISTSGKVNDVAILAQIRAERKKL